ncbi:unnamed protein product [Leptosia nina]|uniref:Secreted protein n=1 Tax=Leptosia nina TaxID=320188 RepID=A0AAV1JP01_9NEOP
MIAEIASVAFAAFGLDSVTAFNFVMCRWHDGDDDTTAADSFNESNGGLLAIRRRLFSRTRLVRTNRWEINAKRAMRTKRATFANYLRFCSCRAHRRRVVSSRDMTITHS